MQTQRTANGALTPLRQARLVASPVVVPQRSARRATARRASRRRAAARQRKDDVEGRIIEYLKDHPQSTTGDIAKRLNVDRGTIAAAVSHLVRARKVTRDRAGKSPWRRASVAA